MEGLQVLFGSVTSLLLAVVAFFMRQLHADFKNMEKDLGEVKVTTTLIKSEFKGTSDLLNQKVGYLERRIEILESKFSTHNE